MDEAQATVPALAVWHTVAQGGKWHCEGPRLADHVERMLTMVFAIADGATLLDAEEFAREKDLALDIVALERDIRTHKAFLCAFALVHDIGKPVTLSFDAPADTRGAKEGFAVRKKDALHPATDAERQRYDKLCRAYAVAHPGTDAIKAMVGFYDAYGIAVHYHNHETAGVAHEYAAQREAVLSLVGLSGAHTKLLTELIRYHIDVLLAFSRQADAKKYEVMVARAGKAGLNVNLFLDLMLAVAFLDAVAGSVGVEGGRPIVQHVLVPNILRAEREAAPKRHEAREEAAGREKKQAYKDALAQAGLDGESVFALLGTPIGPERGTVMAKVMAAVHDPTETPDFGGHTQEILRRAQVARERLSVL